MISSPEAPEDASDSNNPFYDFVKNDWNGLCDSLASEGFPENGYRDLIDMSTFVDFLMVNEITRNLEASYPKSVFAYKDKGGKISMGPLWDFDWAYSYVSTGNSHGYFSVSDGANWTGLGESVFYHFFQDPVFLDLYKKRWKEKRTEIADLSNLITEYGVKLEAAVAEDTKRWKIPGGYFSDYPTDYIGELSKMSSWWKNRVNWLNSEITANEPVFSQKSNPLKAWARDRQLRVAGLTQNKVWSIYNIMGALVYRNTAADSEAIVRLPAKGMYIVQCENHAIKVLFH
jgi:hypothetical protein